jgi:hypothetical protein
VFWEIWAAYPVRPENIRYVFGAPRNQELCFTVFLTTLEEPGHASNWISIRKTCRQSILKNLGRICGAPRNHTLCFRRTQKSEAVFHCDSDDSRRTRTCFKLDFAQKSLQAKHCEKSGSHFRHTQISRAYFHSDSDGF